MIRKWIVVVAIMALPQCLWASDWQRLKEAEKNQYQRVYQVKEKIVFSEQRTVDVTIKSKGGAAQIVKAIIEGDYVNYQLSFGSEVLGTKVKWRKDLSERYEVLISQQQAEVMVEGDVQFSNLFVISCDSRIFVFDSCPQNPCWVIYSLYQGQLLLSVIDALTGQFLGYAVPPPSAAYISSGPVKFDLCSGHWRGHTYLDWDKSAKYWLDLMGYETQFVQWPDEEDLQIDLFKNPETTIWYEMAHGSYREIYMGCVNDGKDVIVVRPSDIDQWLLDQPPVRFSFLANCEAMIEMGEGTMAYALTKGQSIGTAVVGYRGMDTQECAVCWSYSADWQKTFFEGTSQELSVGESFDLGMQEYLSCMECIDMIGDENLKLVPLLERQDPPNYGDVFPLNEQECGDHQLNIGDLMTMVRFALSVELPNQCQLERADVPTLSNGQCLQPDQKIDLLDIMAVIDKILGKENCLN